MQVKPVAYIFSNANIIADFLIKELLNKSCKVIVVTNQKNRFAEYQLYGNDLVVKSFKEELIEIPSYVFLIQGQTLRESFFSKKEIREVLNFSEKYAPKTQVVLPYVVDQKHREIVEHTVRVSKKTTNRNLDIIFLGEVYAPADLDNSGWVNGVFRNIASGIKIPVPLYDFDLYVIEAGEAVRTLVRGIFSYGFDKKEIVVTSRVKAFSFLGELQNIFPKLELRSDKEIMQLGTVSNFDFLEIPLKKESLEKALQWFLNNKKVAVRHVRKKSFKLPLPQLKGFALSLLILIWVLGLPFLLLFVSSLSLRVGFYDISRNNLGGANSFFDITGRISDVSKFGFGLFSKIPFVKGIFNEGLKASLSVDSFSVVGKKSVDVLVLGEKLKVGVLGDADYDLKDLSSKIFLDLDDLYKQISFLQADIGNILYFKFFLPSDIDLTKLKLYVENGRVFASGLGELFGLDKKVNYLVLVNDEKELRPTGGVISSFGIFSFEGGRILEKNFFDTATFDKQLKGHVEPPLAIKKYLGEQNWFLRDSNWDPDFRTAGAKAEWFLMTEAGQNVDGVIAFDSEFFNKLKDFKGNFSDFGKTIFSGLDSKDIQVFLNDNGYTNALENLNADGGVVMPTCLGNCIGVGVGIVEANLGANKVNPSIYRNANLLVNLVGEKIQNRLEINFANSSKTEAYRTYVRVLAPGGASFEKVSETIGDVSQTKLADISNIDGRAEAGVLVQIPPSSKARVIFSWEIKNNIDYLKSGKILFSFRKQAGISNMPIDIRFNLPNFLTQTATTRYNTGLTRDFETEFNW